jgi:hypothetical protein
MSSGLRLSRSPFFIYQIEYEDKKYHILTASMCHLIKNFPFYKKYSQ